MTQVEDYFTDDDMTTGFVSLLNEYQNNLDNVKDADGSETSRQAFISSAQTLSTFFHNVNQELSSLQSSINDQIKTTVENINAIAEKMAL
jgi:flagellar hook-associated protein 1 FlgK